ncbi:ABC transporter substrate-binding protein [Winogradskyella sp.]|uniref:ABC transporter substrate-binding protein n=1 Tax=Winogradskyella sp. TaxID=1883156 RepID=UPI003F6ACBC6
MTYKDQLNRKLQLNKTPKRIVSLVPSQTELLYDLGLEDVIVGITKFCVHPKHLKKTKTIVGGTKQIKFQKIKNLQPDIILCNKEENTKELIEILQPIAPIHISDIYTVEDCYKLIRMYGELFEVESEASSIILKIKQERKQFINKIKGFAKPVVAYFIWKNPWMVAASNTFINSMITEAGFTNGFKSDRRYPEVELNDPRFKEIDRIFLSSEPFPFKTESIEELKLKFPKSSIEIVDGELFSWYGSRLIESYRYFEKLYQ